MVWFKLIFFLFFAFNLNSQVLTPVEKSYFNILDLNNDNYISYEELNQAISIVFQLIDKNQDTKISIEEISELKEIIETLK